MENSEDTTRKENLAEQYGSKYTGEYFYFGVSIESPDPRIISEVTRDVIGLIGALPPNVRLGLVSPSVSDLRARLQGAFDNVDFMDDNFKNPKTVWKAYYIKSLPIPQEGVVYKFLRHIPSLDVRKKITLRPSKPNYPNTNLPNDYRQVPPGMSPSTMRPTYRGPAPQGTPQLIMWSGNEGRLTDTGEQSPSLSADDYLVASVNRLNREKADD